MSSEVLVSVLALVVSFSLLVTNCIMIRIQVIHNMKSLQPECNIRCTEYNQSIRIEIWNCGMGNMTIDSIDVKDNETDTTYKSLYKIFPSDIKLHYFSIDICGSSIAVNGHITLIEIKNFDKEEGFDRVRKILSRHTINVHYHDTYKNFYETPKDLKMLYGRTHRENS